MITKFSSSQSLVNNNISIDDFAYNRIFKSYVACDVKYLSCKSFYATNKKSNSKGLVIHGMATTYNNSDCVKDVLSATSFSSQINEDGVFKTIPFMYYEHNEAISPGKWTKIKKLDVGIQVEGIVYDEEICEAIKDDKLGGLSIGFYNLSSYTMINNRTGQKYRYIEKANLVEISLVARPANSKAFFSPKDLIMYGASCENSARTYRQLG